MLRYLGSLTLLAATLASSACTQSDSRATNGRTIPATQPSSAANPGSGSSLTFELDVTKITAASVAAFIVGHPTQFLMAPVGTNGFSFKQILAGSYDLVVTGTATDGTKLGLRSSGVAIADDKPVDLGTLTLSALGSVKGIATLASKTNFSATGVDIPGTPYHATTDATGEYAIIGIPAGAFSVHYAATGFIDQTIAGLTLGVGEDKTLAAVALTASTSGSAAGGSTSGGPSPSPSPTATPSPGSPSPSPSSSPQSTTPPANGSVTLPNNATTTPLVMPTFTISSSGATEMRLALSQTALAGASWVVYSTSYQGLSLNAALPDGAQQVWYQFRSSAAVASIPQSTSVVLRRVGPAIASAVVTSGQAATNIATVPLTLTLEANPQTIAAKIEYSCDGTNFATLNFTITPNVNITNPAANCPNTGGARTISLRTVDQFFYNGPISTVAINYNITPPLTPVLTGIPTSTQATLITVAGTTSAGANVRITGSVMPATGTADATTGNFSIPNVQLYLNTYTSLAVTASDSAGNSSSATAVVTRVGPGIQTVVTAVNPLFSNNLNVPIVITPDSVSPTTPTNFEFSCDGTLYTLKPYTATPTVNTGDTNANCNSSNGVKTISLRLVDSGNNRGVVKTFSYTYDNIPPVAPTISALAPYTQAASVNVAGSTEAFARVAVSGGIATVTATAAMDGTFTVSSVQLHSNATNTLTVTATDAAGNSSSNTVTVTNDTIAPIINPATTAVDLTSQTALVHWTTNESASGQVQFGLTTAYGGTMTVATFGASHALLITGLAPDTLYHYKFIATDQAGNAATSADATFRTFVDASSAIVADTLWSSLTTSYYVSGNFRVSPSTTLTIGPGVRVVFESNTSVIVEGRLVARGTAANPITLTSNKGLPAAGDWDAIIFPPDCTAASFDGKHNFVSGSILEHVNIAYGGKTNGTIRVSGCALGIFNSTVTKSQTAGLIFDPGDPAGGVNLMIHDSAFTLNGGDGVDLVATTEQATNAVEITNSVVDHNVGWGISTVKNFASKIMYNVISNNQAGGIKIGDVGAILAYNVIQGNGPAMNFCYSGSLPNVNYNMVATSILNNTALNGAAISDTGASGPQLLTFLGTTIYGNTSTQGGSGIISDTQGVASATTPFYTGTKLLFQDGANIFGNTAPYVIANGINQPLHYADVFVKNVWWGIGNDLAIEALFFDNTKNININLVNFRPFAAAPLTSAPLSPPANLARSSTVTGQVSLSWTVSPEAGVGGYHIYYGTTAGAPYSGSGATEGASPLDTVAMGASCSVTSGVETCVVHGLTSSSTYYFAVTSYTGTIESIATANAGADVNTTTGTFTFLSHGFTGGESAALSLVNPVSGDGLPTGVDNVTPYYVLYIDADHLQLSLTNGGAAVVPSAVGHGTMELSGTRTSDAYAPVAINAANVNHGTNIITAAAHGLPDRIRGQFSYTAGNLTPPGILPNTDYYLQVLDADTFKVATGRAGAVIDIGLDTAGVSFPASALSVATSTISAPLNMLVNDTPGQLTTSGTLPTGLAAATTYYVVNRSDSTLQLAASVGGAAIAFSTAGSGTFVFTPTVASMSGQGSFTFTPSAPSTADEQLLGHESWYSTEVSVSVH